MGLGPPDRQCKIGPCLALARKLKHLYTMALISRAKLEAAAWAARFPYIHLLLCLIFIADHVFGFENVVARARRRLNSSAYIGNAVPRLYIYSSADQMVPAPDVETHAKQARRAGYSDVANLRFEASGHCAHASRYAEQYWDGIARLFDKSNIIAQGWQWDLISSRSLLISLSAF
ncbi:hypothetical protein VC83_05956 [Pseudogymnoascus destructans]|uniref:Uncharacterized protein n=1 Tax=Pseudogymnoascus destructans TaxID=655981 RepID=A0A177A4H1_9PEZI|nr:uncharacterized protein VC83_05956 [Pseudogymnoascus destructans]OAF57169.2 hypothetical protein VC83_05956 [Pseudogymnoascus destructans]